VTEPETLDLGSLFQGRPGLTPSEGGRLAEAALVCLDQNSNTPPVNLRLTGRYTRVLRLVGPVVNGRMRRTHADLQDAAEYGGAALATLIVEVCEGLTVYERARKDGHGFDYYLTPFDQVPEVPDDDFFAPATAIMEVSGILSGEGRVPARVREKRERLKLKPKDLPAYVVVTEFGVPMAQMECYEPGA